MKHIGFLNKLKKSLDNGGFFIMLFSISLKVLAILVGLGYLFVIFSTITTLKYLKIKGIFGFVFSELILLIGVVLIIFMMWYRANDIEESRKSEVTILHIVSILFKLMGEVGFIAINFIGITGAISTWIAAKVFGNVIDNLIKMIPFMGIVKYLMGSGAIFSFILIISSIIYSILFIAFFYFWSNVIDGFKTLVENTKAIKLRIAGRGRK